MRLELHWVYVICWLVLTMFGSCLEPASADDKVWYSFCDPSKTQCPSGTGSTGKPQGLILDGSGDLYGVAELEGTAAAGAIFELDPSAVPAYIPLYNFCPNNIGPGRQPCTDGDGPLGLLVRDSNGNLYGTTNQGGSTVTDTFTGLEKSTNLLLAYRHRLLASGISVPAIQVAPTEAPR